MEIIAARPAQLARTAPATSRATSRAAGAKAAAVPHPAAAHPAHPAHPAAPAGPEDIALLAQQAAFDRMMQERAELQREANALRDLAMEQVKKDDALMGAWIKLI
jgi:hypothetical protein